MFTLFVVFGLLFVFMFAGMAHYANKASKLESLARNSNKLLLASRSNAEAWKEYAESLERQIAELSEQGNMLRSFYHATYSTMKDSYGKLLSTVNMVKPTNGNNGNGNSHKDNGNNPKPQQSAQSDNMSKTQTLADLGNITPREQAMIDKWHKTSTPDAECVKRINNIRQSEAKRQTV